MKKILRFFSPTCGPCKVMSKALSALEGVEIQDIDITNDDNETLLDKWKPRTVPTVIVLDEEGNLVKEFKGIVPLNEIEEVL